MSDDSWLTPEVVAAVARHMNVDHGEDSVLIVRTLGGVQDAVEATTSGIDLHGITFSARTAGGDVRAVTIPFSTELTGRADIRAEVVRMYQAAGGAPREHPGDPHPPGPAPVPAP